MVFFAIEGSLLPWTKKARKVAKLFSMVKNADKPLFGTGGAMQFLVYYQATDMLPCEVINGKEKGTTLGHISKYTKYARSRLKNREADPAVGSIGKK